MSGLCNVRHHATERGVVAVLADDHVGEHAAAASHDRDAGVVAAGLDPEDVEPAARNARRKATATRHRHRVAFSAAPAENSRAGGEKAEYKLEADVPLRSNATDCAT